MLVHIGLLLGKRDQGGNATVDTGVTTITLPLTGTALPNSTVAVSYGTLGYEVRIYECLRTQFKVQGKAAGTFFRYIAVC